MAHTYKELKEKTVAELREIASGVEHEAVKGYTQLNKEHLLAALCKVFNLDMYEHHAAKGIDKTAIKKQIRELKNKRTSVLEAHDHAQLKEIRHQIHTLRRTLRRAAV
jgi:hypothetical protein